MACSYVHVLLFKYSYSPGVGETDGDALPSGGSPEDSTQVISHLVVYHLKGWVRKQILCVQRPNTNTGASVSVRMYVRA